MTIVVLDPSHTTIKSLLFGIKCVFISYSFENVLSHIKQNNMNNFHPLEVVDRGSETQLQVGEKFKCYILGLQGLTYISYS